MAELCIIAMMVIAIDAKNVIIEDFPVDLKTRRDKASRASSCQVVMGTLYLSPLCVLVPWEKAARPLLLRHLAENRSNLS